MHHIDFSYYIFLAHNSNEKFRNANTSIVKKIARGNNHVATIKHDGLYNSQRLADFMHMNPKCAMSSVKYLFLGTTLITRKIYLFVGTDKTQYKMSNSK